MNSKEMSSISWTLPYTTVSTIPVANLNLREYKSGINWDQNDIAENFELWMKRKNAGDTSIYSELRSFLKEHRQYIKFDVFLELNKEKLCEWVKLGMKD